MNVDPSTMSTSGDDDYSSKGPYGHVGAAHRMKMLPVDFVPSDDDVICGRGKKCYSHVGNDRFRDRVIGVLDLYRQARTKLDKSKVLNMVVDQVRENSPGGGFVKQDESGRWHEVGDFLAREKTSQAFRDALHENYKSSSVAKKKRRQDEMGKATDRLKMPRSTVDIAQKIQSMSIQMKKAATGGGNMSSLRNDPNADIMAGIQYASRVMRQDSGVGFPAIGGGDGGGGAGFELEFEPDNDYVRSSSSTGMAGGGMGGGCGPSFGVPMRSRSMMDQHSDRSAGLTAPSRVPSLGVNRSFSEGMFQPNMRGVGVMGMMQQQFHDSQSNYSGGENYSAGEESITEELHHSAPNIEFDTSDLMDDTERMHHSAPTLCYYSAADLRSEPAAVPSTIEFQIGTGGGGLLAQQQQKLEQQKRQLMQQQKQLEQMQLAQQQQQLELQQQQLAQQQQQMALQQQNQGYNNMLLGGNTNRTGVGIISSLERFSGMELEDDNPFEPIPINEQPTYGAAIDRGDGDGDGGGDFYQ